MQRVLYCRVQWTMEDVLLQTQVLHMGISWVYYRYPSALIMHISHCEDRGDIQYSLAISKHGCWVNGVAGNWNVGLKSYQGGDYWEGAFHPQSTPDTPNQCDFFLGIGSALQGQSMQPGSLDIQSE